MVVSMCKGKLCCNKCGKQMDAFDENQKFVIHTKIEYGSKHDGSVLNLNLCCECMDELISACKITPLSINEV